MQARTMKEDRREGGKDEEADGRPNSTQRQLRRLSCRAEPSQVDRTISGPFSNSVTMR